MSEAYSVHSDRVAERLAALGLTERKASLLATGQPDTLRFMRTRGTVPSVSRMFKIADVLQATPEYLLGQSESNDWAVHKDVIRAASAFTDKAIEDRQFSSRTIAVIGSKSESGEIEDMGPTEFTLTMTGMTRDVVGFVAGPAGSKSRKLIATYINDPAMAPAFDATVPVVFDLDVEPSPGDYALIFITGELEGRELRGTSFMMRKVVDQTKEWLTLEQHTPSLKFNLPRKFAKRMARVLVLRDYLMPPEE